MREFPQAKKSLGQHFLNDQNVIDKITSDFKEEASALLEVGPGPAVLTKNLSLLGKEFFVIEKDKTLKPILLSLLDEENIIISDALNINLVEVLKERNYPNSNVWLISNLPYNVSVPLYLMFLKIPSIEFLTLMFQKEVAEKILPVTKGKEQVKHSSLSVISEIYFDVKLLLKVSPGSFTPPPKVESKVLSFKRKKDPIIPLQDFPLLEKFLRNLFNFKRKQLQKVLKTCYGDLDVLPFLQKLNFPATIRAEDLTLNEIITLFRSLYPNDRK